MTIAFENGILQETMAVCLQRAGQKVKFIIKYILNSDADGESNADAADVKVVEDSKCSDWAKPAARTIQCARYDQHGKGFSQRFSYSHI